MKILKEAKIYNDDVFFRNWGGEISGQGIHSVYWFIGITLHYTLHIAYQAAPMAFFYDYKDIRGLGYLI